MKLVELLTPQTLAMVCADVIDSGWNAADCLDDESERIAVAMLEQGRAILGNEEFNKLVRDTVEA